MKQTALRAIPYRVPREVAGCLMGARLYDVSSSPEARVYRIDGERSLYLKCSGAGMLEKEARMTEYFHAKGIGAEVLHYSTDERDWLLTAAVAGEDGAQARYLADPLRLCDTIAVELRKLHEMEAASCPVVDRTAEYLETAEQNYRLGRYDETRFSDRFGFRSAQEAYAVLEEGKAALQSDVLLHGDYCLPNIILDQWKLSGFIDVGCGGIGDRHIDLFWGIWTLQYNLKTDRYRERFLDGYGRDRVDEDVLRIVAAAEVFG